MSYAYFPGGNSSTNSISRQNSTCFVFSSSSQTSFQFIFRELSTLCSAILAEVYRLRVTQNFTDRRNAPRQQSLAFRTGFLLRFSLLGVSAVKLDAPSRLISCSPIFPLFQTDIRLFHTFFLISTCLNFLHHQKPTFHVQFLLGTPLCVVQFQHNLGILWYVRTYLECPVVSTTFSHVCHWPTHLFVGSWVPAACSLLSPSTDCQHKVQEFQIPSVVTFKTSHTACLHCSCWRQQWEFVSAVKLADKNSSHPPHVQGFLPNILSV